MLIAIAGPYSAENEEQRQANLRRLNATAVLVYQKGHIPVIGVNAALSIANQIETIDHNRIIMDISMALVDKCESLLLIAESPGANRERDLVQAKGLPVYYNINDIPQVS